MKQGDYGNRVWKDLVTMKKGSREAGKEIIRPAAAAALQSLYWAVMVKQEPNFCSKLSVNSQSISLPHQ